jgi:AICAR transformylase/IMP cyclohydrolase PurH
LPITLENNKQLTQELNTAMNYQQQNNKAMLKKAFLHTALTAATIANFLAVETGKASAHHGWSEYNSQQTLNINGEIQNVRYENPHTVIEVKTKDNKVWQAVLAPPSRMQRRGLPENTLQVGQQVKLVGYPHRTDAREMRVEQIVVSNKTIELR